MRYKDYLSQLNDLKKEVDTENNMPQDSNSYLRAFWERERNSNIKFFMELPNLLKDEEFRKSFIDDKAFLNKKSDCRLSFFESGLEDYLDQNKENATKVLQLILQDEDLKKQFLYKNIKLDYVLHILTKNQPKIVSYLLHNARLIETLENLFSLTLVAGLLTNSCNKRDADYVFENESIFGLYSDDRRRRIYGRISENFQALLPNTLQTFSLFAVANNKSMDISALPQNLQNDIQNIRCKNDLIDIEDSGDESELLAKDWNEERRGYYYL